MIRPLTLNPHYPITSLGDVVEFLDHKRKPITAKNRKPGPYPYYGANGVQDHVEGYIFDEPLVLLAEDGGYFGDPMRNIAYQIQGKCWVNNHAHVLRPKPAIDIRYLCRHLEKYDITSLVNGATRAKLNKSAALGIPISLPPLEEQRRIAAILDKADAIRRKRQQAIELTETFLRSVFLDMFGDPVTNPKGWDARELGKVASISSGVTKGRKFIDKKTIHVPYMRVANVQDGHIRLDDVAEIQVLENDVEKYALKKGDLLLTEGGDPDKLGRGAVWQGWIDPCIHQNHIFKVRFDQSILLPEFANQVIGSQRGKRYFMRSAKQTTGIASINMTQLKGFPILVPPIEMQQEFIAFTRHIISQLGRQNTQENSLNNLFNALSQKAFKGELTASPELKQALSA